MNVAPPDLRRSERTLALGRLIDRRYAHERPILIATLDTALFTLADVARSVAIPCEVDMLSVGGSGTGSYRFVHDLTRPLEGRHALLLLDRVGDIDRLTFILAALNERRPATLALALYESPPPSLAATLGSIEILSPEVA